MFQNTLLHHRLKQRYIGVLQKSICIYISKFLILNVNNILAQNHILVLHDLQIAFTDHAVVLHYEFSVRKDVT